MITVILNGYKRPHTLKEQYEALKAQTVDDLQIMFWGNIIENVEDFPSEVVNKCVSSIANTNLGTWGRFSFALFAKTPYVCVMDDDTIPGKKWFENCLQTMETHRGVLSTRGCIMSANDHLYPFGDSYTPVGWCDPNPEPVRVDMGCHSWFFEKDWLRAYWAEMPAQLPQNFGGDTHISYAVKKHFGYNTYIPPHPLDDMDMWGSIPEKGLDYGQDGNSISESMGGTQGMNSYWNYVKQNGYRTIREENEIQN